MTPTWFDLLECKTTAYGSEYREKVIPWIVIETGLANILEMYEQ